ncbi:hypothetical protein METBIDRAFT_11037 [Metschnikowia bicuspidata var. bicuspidata NRRL YB-4993]|uniref:TPR-like protein n=1 Tax=Metschnikowia bicuspidata var. bicuspidata NRRL YB-4993 TaxID=869754 RepID=A0A1A0HDS2_9ASCO|nr:hypothetical protein METBIDRAFT_11037 [Metschnikowia bicuspidata var. bicuspidata NRRL YB-4993]OBA22161.1 hypothetical protein METBIDRAFT_11037 [Metschnikowia bicuspidata var. bicuspidata NRRL YB-4993]
MFRTFLKSARPSVKAGASPGRHFARLYNYSHFAAYQAPPSKFKRFITMNLYLASLTAFAYYMWWPKHTFPPSVAKILRKGLWAESDKGEKDYELALKHYLEALEECRGLQVDRLSDEYTGIQLKVGEMYERMGMADDAAFVYNEIATLYLSVLKAPANSAQGARVGGRRGHLIQKDLRVALKLVDLNRENPLLAKAILITHLLIAQEEANRRMGLGSGAVSLLAAGDLLGLSSRKDALEGAEQELASMVKDLKDEDVIVLQTNPEAWEPFAEEFFSAMDLLSAICVAVGDIKAASSVRVSMTSKMLVAGMAPDKLLLSQCNTASLLYFQAEQLQAEEQALRQKMSSAAGVDYAKVKAIHDPLQPIAVLHAEAEEIRDKIAGAVLDADKRSYEEIVANKQKLIEMVIATYESVIRGSKTLPQDVVRDNTTISETVALATYGLGVVNLHLSQYESAERLLREARVRSRSCGYDGLITEIERELQKLFNEKNAVMNKDEGIEMDIHLVK